MFAQSLNLRSFMAATALAVAAAASPGVLGVGMPGSNVVSSRQNPSKRQRRYGHDALAAASRYPNSPGWSNRQVKRMALKKRNVKANRRNHRG